MTKRKATRRHPRGKQKPKTRPRAKPSRVDATPPDSIRTIFDEKTCAETLIVRFGPEHIEVAMSGDRAVMLSLELQRASRDAAQTRERLKAAAAERRPL